MKKITKKMLTLMAMSTLLISNATPATQASAAAYREMETFEWYACEKHGHCSYVALASTGDIDTGDVYDVYWSSSYTHWPNTFECGNTWSLKVDNVGYARGTYAGYSSLLTQWTSLTFGSVTNTITHTYTWDSENYRHIFY